MKVPKDITKCVAFVCYLDLVTETLIPIGSVFFIGRIKEGRNNDPVYAVTAKHVIEGLLKMAVEDIYILMNTNESSPTSREFFKTHIKNWFSHTDTSIDVAIIKMGIPTSCDHLVLPIETFVTPAILEKNEVGLGDNVFITGLFKHHSGQNKNIPIVRTGNIASFDDEQITTEDYGPISAYLIEARSIGGLSGSPVFLNLGHVRNIKGQVQHWNGTEPAFFLLGLIHGHYDSTATDIDTLSPDNTALINEKINTGIAIVVPYYSIVKTVELFESQTTVVDEKNDVV